MGTCNCSVSVGGTPFEAYERLHARLDEVKDNEIKALKTKLAACAPRQCWSIPAWCALFTGVGVLAVFVIQCILNAPPRVVHPYEHHCCIEDAPYYPRYK